MHKAVSLADARIKNDVIHWYVTHYKPSIQQQGTLSEQLLSKTPQSFDILTDLFLSKK